jgi:hypothetical protein
LIDKFKLCYQVSVEELEGCRVDLYCYRKQSIEVVRKRMEKSLEVCGSGKKDAE